MRCAGLSRIQSRLQALPATLYLIGTILIIAAWIKLALDRRIFSFRQVLFLALTGSFGFSVVVAGTGLRYNGALSLPLGGITSLVGIFQLLAIYHFLPQPYTLPRMIDRLLAALFASSMILNFLSSVHLRGSADSIHIVYAEATCLICFYFTCIAASIFPRFFVLVMEDCIERQRYPPKMPLITTATFLGSIILFIAQACIAFSLYPTFASVFVASMASGVAYLLLVATFIIDSWSQRIEFHDNVSHYNKGRSVSAEHRSKDRDIVLGETQLADPPMLLNSPQRKAPMTTVLEDEAGNVVHISNEVVPSDTTHRQVDYDRGQRSAQTQTGSSRTSWARIQNLLLKKNQQARFTCASGVTDYGTETSFPEGCKTERNSMMSSFAMAVGGYGKPMPQPPVIAHQVQVITRAESRSSESIQDHKVGQGQSIFKTILPSFLQAKDKGVMDAPADEGRLDLRSDIPGQYQSSKLFPVVDWRSGNEHPVKNSLFHRSEVKYTMKKADPLSQSATSFASTDTAVNSVPSPRHLQTKVLPHVYAHQDTVVMPAY